MGWWIFQNTMQFDIVDVSTQEDDVWIDDYIRDTR